MADAEPRANPHSAELPDELLLRYRGSLAHYTGWSSDFAIVENQYDLYRRVTEPTEVTLQRREVLHT
ncbi:hypothetical protein EGH21_21855 [Halomicroarcula sp. F13]|uniref:Uncharacterized protein n=1 Tax=Haloarcula rubra TaxID=2487747 RepID=A0AAW4PYU8_9EURY|nr:hypothetical protein [Halomicroarcula rubra]MBX0325665.1 hypothetical protein [Halomicroarcula rubra]